uniref:Putative secreted protein n=1 Tax=Anopheles darlingi TaxID=43151 RepID=A0A2M4DQW1_ANODA
MEFRLCGSLLWFFALVDLLAVELLALLLPVVDLGDVCVSLVCCSRDLNCEVGVGLEWVSFWVFLLGL